MKKRNLLTEPLLILLSVIMAATVIGCSDDEPGSKTLDVPDSLIKEFVNPDVLFHEFSDFNITFLYSTLGTTPAQSEISGCRLEDFSIMASGDILTFERTPYLFLDAIKAYNDTSAYGNLPADAWNYRPFTKPISAIHINTLQELLPDLAEGEDCSRYFDVSYVSYYDFIRNGYSWQGMENPGPLYKMSIAEFNNSAQKHLVDAGRITFHLSQEVSKHYTEPNEQIYHFSITIDFSDGSSINYKCIVVNYTMRERLHNIIKYFNTGKSNYFPEWPMLRSPKR